MLDGSICLIQQNQMMSSNIEFMRLQFSKQEHSLKPFLSAGWLSPDTPLEEEPR